MSTIYEALKKVETKNNPSLIRPVFAKTEEKREILPGKKKKPPFPPLIVVIAVPLLVLSFVGLKTLFGPEAGVNKERKMAESGNRVFIPKKYSKNRYILEGILYDQEVSSAIVNGKVVKTGDRIGNLKVIDIRSDRIEVINLKNYNKSTLTF